VTQIGNRSPSEHIPSRHLFHMGSPELPFSWMKPGFNDHTDTDQSAQTEKRDRPCQREHRQPMPVEAGDRHEHSRNPCEDSGSGHEWKAGQPPDSCSIPRRVRCKQAPEHQRSCRMRSKRHRRQPYNNSAGKPVARYPAHHASRKKVTRKVFGLKHSHGRACRVTMGRAPQRSFHCTRTLPPPGLQTPSVPSGFFIKLAPASLGPSFARTIRTTIVSSRSSCFVSICRPIESIGSSPSSSG